jgi:HAD superfamily hydrolase (TIGR01490 family)
MAYAFFDLDHTLLNGDSDVLWVEFLVAEGLVHGPEISARNIDVSQRYKTGAVHPQEFTDFYVGTLVGRSPNEWEPIRRKFYQTLIAPMISERATALVEKHRSAGDTLVLTSATNTFLTELTAQGLGIDHLLGSVPERVDGQFTGTTTGVLNLREGKVVNIHSWLSDRGESLAGITSHAYSDSINDLPLLECVNHPVVVHPDAKLAAIAQARGWPFMDLY